MHWLEGVQNESYKKLWQKIIADYKMLLSPYLLRADNILYGLTPYFLISSFYSLRNEPVLDKII